MPVIFGVKKYAAELVKVAKRKNIDVRYRTVLKEVRHDKKEAVFYNKLDDEKVSLGFCTGEKDFGLSWSRDSFIESSENLNRKLIN